MPTPLSPERQGTAQLRSAVRLSTDKLNLLEERLRRHRAGAAGVMWANGPSRSKQDITYPGRTRLCMGKWKRNRVDSPDKRVTYHSWSQNWNI